MEGFLVPLEEPATTALGLKFAVGLVSPNEVALPSGEAGVLIAAGLNPTSREDANPGDTPKIAEADSPPPVDFNGVPAGVAMASVCAAGCNGGGTQALTRSRGGVWVAPLLPAIRYTRGANSTIG